MATAIRINRFFTEHGVCSRRAADKYVDAGRVRINDVVAVHGDTVKPGDTVTLDGKRVAAPEKRPVVLAYHKPPGIECTSDKRVAENIIDAVGYPERIFHVGRLDKWSEGLILPPFARIRDRSLYMLRAVNNGKYKPFTNASIAQVRGGYKLHYYFGYRQTPGDGLVRLYDLESDPEEMNNLSTIKRETTAELLNELKATLQQVDEPYR